MPRVSSREREAQFSNLSEADVASMVMQLRQLESADLRRLVSDIRSALEDEVGLAGSDRDRAPAASPLSAASQGLRAGVETAALPRASGALQRPGIPNEPAKQQFPSGPESKLVSGRMHEEPSKSSSPRAIRLCLSLATAVIVVVFPWDLPVLRDSPVPSTTSRSLERLETAEQRASPNIQSQPESAVNIAAPEISTSSTQPEQALSRESYPNSSERSNSTVLVHPSPAPPSQSNAAPLVQDGGAPAAHPEHAPSAQPDPAPSGTTKINELNTALLPTSNPSHESHPVAGIALGREVVEQLIERGNYFLIAHDIVAARSFYERAAAAGSSAAAFAVARTFDPRFLAQMGAAGARPDPERAAFWYRAAKSLDGQQDSHAATFPLGSHN
jgi:hypothetical protein